jgi:hypothetical protein
MSRIFNRPMFKLGGKPNSDGVGITSGLNRTNYSTGKDYISQMESMLGDVNKQLENVGKIDQYDAALMLSNVLGKGGSIYDMVTNAGEEIIPRYANYKKAQASIPSLKFQNLGTMAGLKIKEEAANQETATAMKERLGMKALGLDLTVPGNQEKYDLWMKIAKGTSHISQDEAMMAAAEIFYDSDELLENTPKSKHKEVIEQIAEIFYTKPSRVPQAHGSRPGYSIGMGPVMDQQTEAVDIQTPTGNEEIVDTQTEVMQPGASQDPFVLLRARLPKEITDDVVRLIAYNPEAFKDFAAIESQQDVINFNITYGVELVIPTSQV